MKPPTKPPISPELQALINAAAREIPAMLREMHAARKAELAATPVVERKDAA